MMLKLLYCTSQKCMYAGLISLLGIRILIRLYSDLFVKIRILERAMAVFGAIF
jgi:hypothetical protein